MTMETKEELLNIEFEANLDDQKRHIKMEQPKKEMKDLLESICCESSHPLDNIIKNTHTPKLRIKDQINSEGFEALLYLKDYSFSSDFEIETKNSALELDVEQSEGEREDSSERYRVKSPSLLGTRKSTQENRKIGSEDDTNQQKQTAGYLRTCKIYNQVSNDELEYKRHRISLLQGISFDCKCCNKKYEIKIDLDKLKKLASRIYWPCNICNKVCKNKYDLMRHSRTHAQGQILIYCKKSCNQTNSSAVHTKSGTRKESTSCKVCNKTVCKPFSFRQHMQSHSDKKKLFSCASCGKSFGNKFKLRSHMRSHMRISGCNLCDKKFDQTDHLKMHLMTHPGNGTFPCADCLKIFISKDELAAHMKTHTDQISYACNICDKIFKRRVSLTSHIMCHRNQRPSEYESCDRRFRDASSMKHHVDTVHTHKKILSRNCCDETNSNKGNLVIRNGMHAKTKLSSCEICGNPFRMESNLESHAKVHETEKISRKDSCEVRSTISRNKNVSGKHEMSHMGTKLYFICNYCGSRYGEKLALEGHIKAHMEGRISKSDVCGKRCTTKGGMRSHSRSREYRSSPCELCCSGCESEGRLNKHMRCSHPRSLFAESVSTDDFRRELKISLVRCEI